MTRFVQKGLLLALLIHVLAVRAVSAHAELVRAHPAPGSVVNASPPTIWIEFSETLRPGSEVTLYGTGFRAVGGVQAVLDLTQPTRLVAALPELGPDNYTVQWTSVSVDGDTLSGSYSFGVRPTETLWLSQVGWLIAGLALLGLGAWWLRRQSRSVRRRSA